MTKTVHGIVRGKTIELDEELGVAEGQSVEIQVTVLDSCRTWGQGILRTAGALSEDTDWDSIMDEIHHNRKLDRRTQLEN